MSPRRTPPLALYAAATGLLEPLAPLVLRARARRGKEDAARLTERLGHAGLARPDRPVVWLHGVSVGESLSLLPLAAALAARRPDLALVATSGTVTSAELLARRLPPGVVHQYAPVDGPAAVARFLDHWRPSVGVLVESELWPNLIGQARARGVRMALVSARMTKASARSWARARASAQALLSAFELILPQDEASAARLAGLGARIGPRLNLKLAGEPLPCDPAELARLRETVAGRKVVLAASTHPGEEGLIAEAFGRAASASGADALLVVAPRHPDRGEAVAATLGADGAPAPRRSQGAAIGPRTRAYVADTLGELGLFFRLAEVAVMGGGFVEGIGGHNPLEPARLGAPVVSGPHVFNAAEVYAELHAEAAAITAADGAALARHIEGLLTYPHIARRIGEAGRACAERQAQALERALDLISPLAPA